MSFEEVCAAFKAEVYDRADKIDPVDVLDWDDLAMGFALGKGCSVEVAHKFWTGWSKYCH